jgi:DNA-directed RNA polymerase specialized sigma24 family protein
MNTDTIKSFTAEEFTSMPLKTAMMLRDHLTDGKTYKQVALAHDVPVGTVRSRFNRARAKVANMRAAAANTIHADGRPAARA